jgi:hypothetical protein
MDKDAILKLVARARKQAEDGDADIEAQHQIITALQRKGLDSARAHDVLAKLISAQEVDLTEMERLLDELDNSRP